MTFPMLAMDAPANPARHRARALAVAMAAALVAQPSHAMMLGEPEVHSWLGRPLDLRIPFEGSGADTADESCFSLLPASAGGLPGIPRAQLSIEQQAGRAYLRVRSTESINEPAAILRLQVGCNGSGILVRQYGVLLDPMPVSLPSASPVMRATSAAPPRVASVQPVAPQRATAALSHSSGASRHSTPAHAHARHLAHKASTRHAAHRGGYLLKLSGPVLDLAPSRNIGEAQRVQLREARALLEADDYTAAMLALRDRIDALQRRVAELQVEAAALETPRVPAASMPSAVATLPNAPAFPRVTAAARVLVDASWWWALVAMLGLAALFLPIWRVVRRRKAVALAPEGKSFTTRAGVETGRFAPPPALRPPQSTETAAGTKFATEPAPALVGDDTEEAIRNARDLYNAGDRLQAAGVLRLAIESHPQRVAPWLPLFDLLMRERLVTEFEELARGFRALHGASPAWKTVQRAGQQIDPGNSLYRDDARAEHQAAA